MIKTDLTRSIAEQMDFHTKDAETFLTTFTDNIASGEPVRGAGCGVIDVNHITAYEAGDPSLTMLYYRSG